MSLVTIPVRKVLKLIRNFLLPKNRTFYSLSLRITSFVVILTLFSTSIFIIFDHNAPTARAVSTVGSSSVSGATAGSYNRTIVESSKGITLAVFQAGIEGLGGLSFKTSSDNTVNWSSATQIDSSATTDFSIIIDGSDNVYVAYVDSGSIKLAKLSYVSSSWSVGPVNTVKSAITCVTSTNDGLLFSKPGLAMDYSGKIWVSANSIIKLKTACSTVSNYSIITTSSNNLTSWNDSASIVDENFESNISMINAGSGLWLYGSSAGLYYDSNSIGAWNLANNTITSSSRPLSMAYSLNEIVFFYQDSSSNLVFKSFSLISGALSAGTVISSNTNDILGTISTDSYNHWVTYQSYVGVDSYNVVFKRFNGIDWDSTATAITADNTKNFAINSPARLPDTSSVPVVWNNGTTSPFTIKSDSISTFGTVTDSGNHNGEYSGTLTGSSGDQIVKSGEWWYSTINVVSGMAVRVLAFDGVLGGSLSIHAQSVIIAGQLDGNGRGNRGGFSLPAIGGSGGGGGAGMCPSSPTPSRDGTIGISRDGNLGSGLYGGSSGTKGQSATSFGAGGAISMGGGNGFGTSSVGSNGSNGGYLGTESNGDTTESSVLYMGSGGGSGGSGGSGSGAGGGGGGMAGGTTEYGGSGGSGGSGASGGSGGPGGSGGAIVKIYSTSTVNISGSIKSNGTPGVAGGSAQSGNNGVDGSAGYTVTSCSAG